MTELQFIGEFKVETNNKHDPTKIYTKYIIYKDDSEKIYKQKVHSPENGIFNQEVELTIPDYTEDLSKRDIQLYTVLRYKLCSKGSYDLSSVDISTIPTDDQLAAVWLEWTDGEFGMAPYTIGETIKFTNEPIAIKLPESDYLDYHIGINLYYIKKTTNEVPYVQFKPIEDDKSIKEGNINLNFIHDQKNIVTIGQQELTIGYTRQIRFLDSQ